MYSNSLEYAQNTQDKTFLKEEALFFERVYEASNDFYNYYKLNENNSKLLLEYSILWNNLMIEGFSQGYISPLGTENIFNIINPMSYRDPTMIITGTSEFPYLAGLSIMSLYNILLYFINKLLLLKKEFYN